MFGVIPNLLSTESTSGRGAAGSVCSLARSVMAVTNWSNVSVSPSEFSGKARVRAMENRVASWTSARSTPSVLMVKTFSSWSPG